MRSYYSHLEAVQPAGQRIAPGRKPIFRSSAVFPVLHNAHQSSKILFMGYWLLKRNIREIGLLYTLRNAGGEVISRNYLLIDSPKAYSIQVKDLIELQEISFTGSLEIEIFSTQDLVYPYPAFVLVYYGENFSTVVHTVGRVYNDIEDLAGNEEYKVRESGFDIRGGDHFSPFIALTNGPIANKHPQIKFEIVQENKPVVSGEFSIPPLAAYETIFIYLNDHIALEKILANDTGTIRLAHNFEGFFPRFVSGNFEKNNHSISITHSYYDSSAVTDAKAFWSRSEGDYNDSSVSIPLYIKDGFYTRLVIYPVFSPSDFSLSYFFYDGDGILLSEIQDLHHVLSSEAKYQQIDLGEIIRSHHIDQDRVCSVNIICSWHDGKKIPTRVKFGLNVGRVNYPEYLPSNICFAPQVANPAVLAKKGTFRWAPFVNIGSSEIVFTNSSFEKKYDRPANVKLQFHREADNEILTREILVPSNGMHTIKITNDHVLENFLEGRSGWVSANSDNPFLNGYYFDFFESGAVGADHIF